MSKLIAFALMGIGALIVLGIIGASSHNIHHVAVVLGTYSITWFQMIAAGMFGGVCYLTMKI